MTPKPKITDEKLLPFAYNRAEEFNWQNPVFLEAWLIGERKK
jgi:hypothetical protein